MDRHTKTEVVSQEEHRNHKSIYKKIYSTYIIGQHNLANGTKYLREHDVPCLRSRFIILSSDQDF